MKLAPFYPSDFNCRPGIIMKASVIAFLGVNHFFSYISSMKSKTATIFVSGNECLFLSTSFFLALLHGGSVPIIVGTMNNYVNFLFEIKTQPGVLLRPKR